LTVGSGQNVTVNESTPEDVMTTRPHTGLETGSADDGLAVAPVPPGGLRGKLASVQAEWQVPLYRNAYLLMLNTAITSALGFVYWFAAAKLHTKGEIGLNAALISAMVLLSAFAQLNFPQVLMRYVPVAGRQTRKLLHWSHWLPASVGIVLTAVVLLVAHFVTDSNNVMNMGFALGIWLTISVAAWSLFNLQDSALIGLREVKWVVIDNAVFGVLKVVLLFPFAIWFGKLGPFIAWTLPVLLSLLPLHWLIFRRLVPRHMKTAQESEEPLDPRGIAKFVAYDYVGWLFAQATITLVPLLVVSVLSEEDNGVYYIVQIIAGALDLFVANLMTSLVVEASSDLKSMAHLSRLVVKRIAVIVLPAVAITLVIAPYILMLFNTAESNYSEEGAMVMRLLAISTVFRVVITLSNALARIRQRTQQIAITQTVQASLIIGLSLVFMPSMGIEGVGLGTLIASIVVALALTPQLLRTISPRFAKSDA
jgi:O-antigen/teichoic acid export membrane protein